MKLCRRVKLRFSLACRAALLTALAATPVLAVEALQAASGARTPAAGGLLPFVPGQEVSASGVFLNPAGDLLTARHAVIACAALYVVKDVHIVEATILALHPSLDLAVLRTSLKPYLSATLVNTLPVGGMGVFAESYSALLRMPDRSSVLSNAITIPGEGAFYLLSGARPGSSGSAVLGGTGLMLGMVVERLTGGPGVGEQRLGRPSSPGGVRVKAIAAPQIAQFLRAVDVPFGQSDVAQLGPGQSPAARAATLAVGIYCR